MPITQIPTPVPSRADPANFAVRADAFLGALPTFVTEANQLATDVTNAESSTLAARNTAVSSASAAQTSASLAGAFAGAQPWVSGSYATGVAVYSPSNFRIYRRKSPGGSATTDPANDATNWQLVNSVFSADNGDVGIGTTQSFGARLHVSSPTVQAGLFSSTVPGAYVSFADSVTSIRPEIGANGNTFVLRTNSADRMVVDTNGNVGIGTTTAASKFEVSSETPSVADFAGSIRVTNTSFSIGTYAGTLFKTGDTLNSFVTAVRKGGFGGTLVFATNRGANANDLVESMRLDDAGRVCINDNSNIFSNLTVRAVGGGSGTFNLSGSAGASYVLLGNRDGLGATGPSVIASSNRAIQFGVGDNHSNTAGGTFTEFGRFSSTGNFGVGINPTVKFEVATSTGGRLRVDTSNPAENIVTSSNFAGTVFSTSISDAAAHVFRTSGTERARIDSAGNFFRGQTGTGNQNTRGFYSDINGYFGQNHQTGEANNTPYAIFGFAGSSIGSITQSGTTGVTYNTTSDYRLKTVEGKLQNSGVFIDALNPVYGSWKADGKYFVGFIAHEVQEVSPSSVVGEKDAVDEQGQPKYQQMDYSSSEIIANLVAELQSLRKRVAELENNRAE